MFVGRRVGSFLLLQDGGCHYEFTFLLGFSSQQWLSSPYHCHLVRNDKLNMLCCSIYCEFLPVELSPSLVGLALTYCIALANSSQYTIKQSTEVENTVYIKS